MRLEDLSSRIKARAFRTIYRSSTSYPYLSGDAFASVVDLVVDFRLISNRRLLAHKISTSRTVFCPSHLVDELIILAENSLCVDILIVGNGDRNFDSRIIWHSKFARYYFLQNSYISDNHRIFTLPIGLENKRLGVNGLIKFNSSPTKVLESPILVGPFSPTAQLRSELSNGVFSRFNDFDVYENRLNLADYSKALHSHKYVLCPEGNGVDTHRLWEALYAGSVPIVSRNSWSDSLVTLGFPLIQTDSWAPMDILNEISRSQFDTINPQEIRQLWIPYWQEKFTKLLEK